MHTPNLIGQTCEAAVPMQREEAGAAMTIASCEEVNEPSVSSLGACHCWSTKLDTVGFQWLDILYPSSCGCRGIDLTATRRECTIGFIKPKDMRDVDSLLQHLDHCRSEVVGKITP